MLPNSRLHRSLDLDSLVGKNRLLLSLFLDINDLEAATEPEAKKLRKNGSILKALKRLTMFHCEDVWLYVFNGMFVIFRVCSDTSWHLNRFVRSMPNELSG